MLLPGPPSNSLREKENSRRQAEASLPILCTPKRQPSPAVLRESSHDREPEGKSHSTFCHEPRSLRAPSGQEDTAGVRDSIWGLRLGSEALPFRGSQTPRRPVRARFRSFPQSVGSRGGITNIECILRTSFLGEFKFRVPVQMTHGILPS